MGGMDTTTEDLQRLAERTQRIAIEKGQIPSTGKLLPLPELHEKASKRRRESIEQQRNTRASVCLGILGALSLLIIILSRGFK